MLSKADSGHGPDLEAWCVYVLTGIRDELKKVSQLADYGYLSQKVLLPAVAHARERQHITAQEENILAKTIKEGQVKSGDLESAMPGLNTAQRTYQIKKLVDGGMLQPIRPAARQYVLCFTHNLLLRGVIKTLSDQGFIPDALGGPQRA